MHLNPQLMKGFCGVYEERVFAVLVAALLQSDSGVVEPRVRAGFAAAPARALKRLICLKNRLTRDRPIRTMCRLSEGFPSGQRDQTVNLTRELRWFESTPLHHKLLF